MSTRICLVGTPRSGSQYIAQLLMGTVKSINGNLMYNAQEPFSINFPGELTVTPAGHINIVDKTSRLTLTLDQHIERTLSILESASVSQSIIIRLFPFHYIKDVKSIFKRLEEIGFDILILKRNNIEEQILSYAISQTVEKWDNFKLDKPIELVNDTDMETLREIIFYFESVTAEKIDQLKNAPIICYENAFTDIEEILGVPVNTSEVTALQRRSADPYEFIQNRESVAAHIKKLINNPRYTKVKFKNNRK